MNIQYYGHSCFKLTTKPAGRATDDIVVFMDPFDKETGLRPPQGHADIALISHSHSDHNNVSALKNNPVIIDSPGEYSIKGINLVGIDSFHDEVGGQKKGKNTIFVLEVEGIKICHLGDLGCDLTTKQLDEIDGVDILFIPIGGRYTLDGKKASEITKKIEPSIVIPMHYKMTNSTFDISDEKIFCDSMGVCNKEGISKLSFKKKDFEDKKMEVIVMSIEN